ncbi:hypothetical protein [Spirosoma fluviale]|uniref:Uncharacterized protein n=1 Tax=Spirosoma fluviale TaxID=1597977 RepID=A0A286F600_9BACT|nr:hypothetical protein [Spirosoma fluviale]SOD78628.1 hypothetical protein SAMN06269250_0557 [Spirosoma fluviale]
MLKIRRLYTSLVFLIVLNLLGGCQPETDLLPDDSAYFPLQTGDYWIYQVTQETYSITSPATTRAFQVQQKISSSFSRNGQLVYQVEESARNSEQSDWKVNAIWTVYRTLSEVVSQENNVPTVSLTFPISAATSWNVNTYNARPDTLLRYQTGSQSITLNKRSFDNVVSVVGPNDSTLIGLNKYVRMYAPNVGLVYRENTALAYCQSTPDCIGKGTITSGSRQKWTLLSSNRLP